MSCKDPTSIHAHNYQNSITFTTYAASDKLIELVSINLTHILQKTIETDFKDSQLYLSGQPSTSISLHKNFHYNFTLINLGIKVKHVRNKESCILILFPLTYSMRRLSAEPNMIYFLNKRTTSAMS